jgi:hypothetical protein
MASQKNLRWKGVLICSGCRKAFRTELRPCGCRHDACSWDCQNTIETRRRCKKKLRDERDHQYQEAYGRESEHHH